MNVVSSQFDKDLVELSIILNVFLSLFPSDKVKRRLCNIEIPAPYQLRHLPAEECKQESPDVGTIHVSISHYDHLVVAHFLQIERPFLFSVPYSRSDCGNHALDLLILKGLVEPSFFHIDQLSSQRKDRLSPSIPALLRRPTCRITLHNVELTLGWVPFGTVSKLTWQTPTRESRFANRLPRFSRSLSRPRRID